MTSPSSWNWFLNSSLAWSSSHSVHGRHFNLFTRRSWNLIMILFKRPCCISIIFIIVVITMFQKRIGISKVSHFETAKIKYPASKMDSFSDQISLDYERKRSNVFKGDRIVHKVTSNSNSASPGDVLMVPIQKLHEGVVLVPRSRTCLQPRSERA